MLYFGRLRFLLVILQAFSEFQCSGEHVFGVQYNMVLEVLTGFSLSSCAPLQVSYEGSECDLIME